MTARSPRASVLVVCHAFIVKLVIIGAGMALAGVVAVSVWVAVFGVSMAAAVVGLPASSMVAGIMLPDCMACWVAAVFAVSAAVPAVVLETFWNFVPAEVSHRCSDPFADCKRMNWFV